LFLTLISPAETCRLWHGWQIALKDKKLLNICVNQRNLHLNKEYISALIRVICV